jgi:hypothetical protein
MKVHQGKTELFKDNQKISAQLNNAIAVNVDLVVSQEKIQEEIENHNKKIIEYNNKLNAVGFYIHIKTGVEYEVITDAINCTNARQGERLIVYRKKDRTSKDGHLTFVRSFKEFDKKFERTL